MKKLPLPQLIVILMLLWGLYSGNPYSYYVLLRLVCFGVFIYLAFVAHAQYKQNWMWVMGFTALVYNPIFRIHLSRDFWTAINLVTIAITAASAIALNPKKQS